MKNTKNIYIFEFYIGYIIIFDSLEITNRFKFNFCKFQVHLFLIYES